jgi:hypothetical protein
MCKLEMKDFDSGKLKEYKKLKVNVHPISMFDAG